METLVHIPVNSHLMEGSLAVPQGCEGLVIFVHGSGSGRHSPRNQYVAQVLRQAGLGTLLFDLLTEEEDTLYENRFDIELLTTRLGDATRWVKAQPGTQSLALGYFGASTGAAAALRAAAKMGSEIKAVVSRGGRPDLSMSYLSRVRVPTLFIVGEYDDIVMELNEQACNALGAEEKEIVVVPRATHLFEEPGALEQVARHAERWFSRFLLRRSPPAQ